MNHSVIVLLAAIACGSGCSAIRMQGVSQWSPAVVAGLSLNKNGEVWSFSRDGSVTLWPNIHVIPGVHRMAWRVDGEWLVITELDGREYGAFRLERVGITTLTVSLRDERKLEFEYRKG